MMHTQRASSIAKDRKKNESHKRKKDTD
jgi:hypothetical protein